MGTSFRWAFRSLAAAAVLSGAAADSQAQIVIHGRPGQPRFDQKNPFAPVRIPATQQFRYPQPAGTKPSAITMPTVNGSSAFHAHPHWNPPADYPWSGPPVSVVRPAVGVNPGLYPFAQNPEFADPPGLDPKPVVRRVRDPFVANQLLMNPLLAHRAPQNPFNGPGFPNGCWGLNLVAWQRGGGSGAVAAEPRGSLLGQPAEVPPASAAQTVYQPVSGVVTLADGSTFYRAGGTGAAAALGNYSGGNFDAELIGGSFFSPATGFVGKVEQTVFLPYVW